MSQFTKDKTSGASVRLETGLDAEEWSPAGLPGARSRWCCMFGESHCWKLTCSTNPGCFGNSALPKGWRSLEAPCMLVNEPVSLPSSLARAARQHVSFWTLSNSLLTNCLCAFIFSLVIE